MRARNAVVLLLVLLGAAPAAGSWVPPPPFRDIAWVDGDTLLTNSAHDVGRYGISAGSFRPLSNASAAVAPRVLLAASPDGRWATYSYGHPPFRDRPTTSGDVIPGETVAFDLASGSRKDVLPSGAMAFAAGPRHLVLAHATEGLLLLPWGDWASPHRLQVRDAAFAARDVRILALDAQETRLVAWVSNGTLPDRLFAFDLGNASAPPRVLVSNVSSFDLLAPEDREGVCCPNSPATRLAVAPDGQRIALGFSQNLGPRSTAILRVLDARTLGVLAERRFSGALDPMDWGPRGLAMASTVNEGGDQPRWVSTLRLLGPDLAPLAEARLDGIVDAVAWSPQGDRLAVGGEGRLRIYDADLGLAKETRIGALSPAPGVGILAVAAAGAALAVAGRRPRG